MKKGLFTLILGLSLFSFYQGKALPFNTSLQGAHFWVEHFSDPGFPQFKLHLVVSYNCNGFSAPPAFNISVDTGQGYFPVQVTAVTGNFSTQLCPLAQLSNDCNGGSGYAYKDIHYATDWMPYATHDVHFKHEDCCMPSGITNIVSPTTTGTRIEGSISRYAASTDFGSNLSMARPVLSPFLLLRSNAEQLLSFGYNISDYDSNNLHQRVRYQLSEQIGNGGSPATYVGPFTFSNPMQASEFELDSITGILKVNPTAAPQEAVVTVQTEVYWNDTVLALSFRNQYTLTVGADVNVMPEIHGFDGANDYDTTVLAGVPFVFQVQTEDNDALDVLSVEVADQDLLELTLPGINIGPAIQPLVTITFLPSIFYAGHDVNLLMRVTDDNCSYKGSNVYAYTLHVVSSLINIDSVNITPNCAGLGDLHVSATSLASPISYSFNGGVTFSGDSFALGLLPGNYTVVVRDDNLNADTLVVNVPVLPPFSVNIDPQLVCFANCNAEINLLPNGGVPPFHFSWSNTASDTAFQTGLCAGTYDVTVFDNNGCTASASGIVNENPEMWVNPSGCCQGTLPDTITAFASGGTPPYNYLWNSGGDSVTIVNSPAVLTIEVTDANGCVKTETYIAGCANQCVWPGDADYDGIANQYDLFALGLAYGKSGYVRDIIDINWVAHTSLDWTDTFSFGTNHKHADCDGDGSVTGSDTLAIVQNFNGLHPLGAAAGGPGAPSLIVYLDKDTAYNGDTLTAHIALGDQLVGAQNVYAVGFTFLFDYEVVDSNFTHLTYPESWLTDLSPTMNMARHFNSNGRIETAITRIDQTHRSGNGEIAKVKMLMNTSALEGKTLEYVVVLCRVDNVRIIDEQGNLLPVNATEDTAAIGYTQTSIREWSNATVKLVPNPVQQQVSVYSTGTTIESIQLENNLGEVVLRQNFEQPSTVRQLSVSDLPVGIYLLKATTPNGTALQKLVKQ